MVELVIVMSIIGIITLAGAPAMISVRDQNIVDAVVDECVSTVREAQNQAVSVKNNKDNETVKVWAVEADGDTNSIKLQALTVSGWKDENTNISPYSDVDITQSHYIYFSTPFGKGYSCSVRPTSWAESSNFEKDYIPSGGTCEVATTLKFNYKGRKKLVEVSSNGDVYAK